MDYNPFRSGRATQQTVQENKFVIPEEIPANERTAFHGAAAAAAKAGKSHFNFAGKKHPVTMAKDTAHKIADQKEDTKLDELSPSTLQSYSKKAKKQAIGLSQKGDKKDLKKFGNRIKGISQADDKMKEGYYKDLEIKKQDKEMGAKPVPAKKKKEAKNGGKEGDVEMNPKMETGGKSEQKESRIRSALKSVLIEKENHSPNQDKAEKIKDARKGKGAEDMMAAADAEIAKGPDAHLNEPEIDKKNFEKMTSNVPSAKARRGDNKTGDKKIVGPGTPMKDPAAMKAEGKDAVTPFKVESYDKFTPLRNAYASMYEKKTVEDHSDKE